jgi:hypothetical protein
MRPSFKQSHSIFLLPVLTASKSPLMLTQGLYVKSPSSEYDREIYYRLLIYEK